MLVDLFCRKIFLGRLLELTSGRSPGNTTRISSPSSPTDRPARQPRSAARRPRRPVAKPWRGAVAVYPLGLHSDVSSDASPLLTCPVESIGRHHSTPYRRALPIVRPRPLQTTSIACLATSCGFGHEQIWQMFLSCALTSRSGGDDF